MPVPSDLLDIPGAIELHDWFGYWPDFHDAEVVHLYLNRTGISSMLVEAWRWTDEVDERGYFKVDKHGLVEFLLEEISEMDLEDFNHQNVIFSLSIERTESGYRFDMDTSFGLLGTIEVKAFSIRLVPAELPDKPLAV
ncbi:MAG TPA: Imm50 family immunity protein [Bryobacteraceae bacterium]|nr:Imm50 family immunity protein [Bryobacteraceae bacterium]